MIRLVAVTNNGVEKPSTKGTGRGKMVLGRIASDADARTFATP